MVSKVPMAHRAPQPATHPLMFKPGRHPPPMPAGGPGRPEEVIVAHEKLVGMPHHEAELTIARHLGPLSGGGSQLDLSSTGFKRRATTRAVRYFLSEEDGEGYWDFFQPKDSFLISVTEAKYNEDAWMNVEGADFFKIRLLLSGELRTPGDRGRLVAPQAMLEVSPGSSREGYFIRAGQWTRMVVLHGRRDTFISGLGLDPREVPPPFDALLNQSGKLVRRNISFGPDLLRAAQRIADSRHRMSPGLRGPRIEALSIEILTQILEDSSNQDLMNGTSNTLTKTDINRVCEARNYLSQQFRTPPTIRELARLVGTNQTKLKTSFRRVVGQTIYAYVLACRMERAAEMLGTGEYNISEVAYHVGYEFPANFTFAFKKYYGYLPRAWINKAPSESIYVS